MSEWLEKQIKTNAITKVCVHCGHSDTIYAITGHPEIGADGKVYPALYFGSDRDFCTKCDRWWDF